MVGELGGGLFQLDQVLHPGPGVPLLDLLDARLVGVREHLHRLRHIVDHPVDMHEDLVVLKGGVLVRRKGARHLRQLVAGGERCVEDREQHGEDVHLRRDRELLGRLRVFAEEVVDP